MYSDRRKNKKWLVAVLIGAALAVLLLTLAFGGAGTAVREESAASIEAAVLESARQCYAVEGVYPPDLAYLQDRYGLQVNTRDFVIVYEAFASNLPPTVRVVEKQGG